MNGLLLDTSGYSGLLKNQPGFLDALEQADSVFLNPITMGELLAGFRKGTHFEANVRLLSDFVEQRKVKYLPIDMETAEHYSAIHDFLRKAGTPVGPNDLWIAASAMQHGLKLLTTDRDFQKIPQILIQLF